MHRDVDHASGDAGFLDRLDIGGEPLRESDATNGNAGEDEPAQVAIALDDLVRDPPQSTPESFRIENADGAVVVRLVCFFHFLRDLAGSL